MRGLLIYYFRGDNRADEPVTDNSETVLDDVLNDMLVAVEQYQGTGQT